MGLLDFLKKYYSIEDLDKNNRRGELIVVRKTWKNDFCFCVEDISDGYAIGTTFLDGEVESENKRYKSDIEEFKIYKGDSRKAIESNYS